MSRKLIPRKLKLSELSRYHLPEVIDHLAANYVMGTLSPRVRNRIDGMRSDADYQSLDERIFYWQKKLSPLDNQTPERPPMSDTWQNIQQQLGMNVQVTNEVAEHKRSWLGWASLSLHRWVTVCSLVLAITFGVVMMQNTTVGAVSYVAVLTDDNQTPQVVATSYADNRDLRLNVLSLPDIDNNQTYELWVTSKTDGQARSLGAIPLSSSTFNRTLTKAEWGLIKDSDKLLITIEAQGGSVSGQPSQQIVSSGLCIRLAPWKAKTG